MVAAPFFISAACIILGDALTGMGIGYVSAVNSFIRQLLVLLPAAWLLLKCFGLNAIWYAFVLSEISSFTYSAIMFRRIWRRKVTPMEAKASGGESAVHPGRQP